LAHKSSPIPIQLLQADVKTLARLKQTSIESCSPEQLLSFLYQSRAKFQISSSWEADGSATIVWKTGDIRNGRQRHGQTTTLEEALRQVTRAVCTTTPN